MQLALHRGELYRSEVCHIFTTPTHKEQTHFRHTWMTCLENQTNGLTSTSYDTSQHASINKRNLKLQSEWDGMDGWTDKGQVVTWNQMLIISSTEQFAMQWHHPSACFDFERKKQEAAFATETDWTDLKRTTAWCGCFFFYFSKSPIVVRLWFIWKGLRTFILATICITFNHFTVWTNNLPVLYFSPHLC